MTIRIASGTDVTAILSLLEAAHAQSKYAGVDTIDKDYTRQLFARALHFNGHSNASATLFLIAETGGQIEGYFLGALDRTYLVGRRFTAQVLHFYLSPGDDAHVAPILDRFMEWAETNPKVVEMRIGESNVFGEPDPRFSALLERKGFKKAATDFAKRTAT